MKVAAVLICILMFAVPAVRAQTASPASRTATSRAVESVTVTGTRDTLEKAVSRFVQHFIAPTHLAGKVGRWELGICPITVGLPPKFSGFVSQRVREIAARVGAPVNANATCRPNIEIVFTTTPQALLDNVRKTHRTYLGYAQTIAQTDGLAIVTHAIQAWYTTASQGLAGEVTGSDPQLDDSRHEAIGVGSSGFRPRDGIKSVFFHVLVVVDPTKVSGYEMGALSDYIAMLALTQLSSLDTCQSLPSIVNLLAPGCTPPPALTDNDLGYLKGLYGMDADGALSTQRNSMSYGMRKSLEQH